MPKVRNPDCEKAEKLFVESGRTLTLKEIAEQLHISEDTVRCWKNRYKWKGYNNATLQIKNQKKEQKKEIKMQ